MPDPAKSRDEIEDVLASIRRLVSDSGATVSDPRRPPPPSDDRLVLTPADRISAPDDPYAPVPAAGAPEDGQDVSPAGTGVAGMDEIDEDGDPAWGLEDRLSDWGEIEESGDEAVADAIAEGEVRGAEAWPDRSATSDAPAPAERTDEPDDVGPDGFENAGSTESVAAFEAEDGDVDWPDRGADTALRNLAAVRGRLGGRAETPEADQPGGTSDQDGDPQDAPPPGAADDGAPATGAGWPGEHDAPTARDGDAAATEDSMHDEETETAGRAPAQDRTFEPVFSRGGVGPGDGDAVQDSVEDLGEDPSPFTFPDAEDGYLDEETLREIVAEVVREELQGALGQRITRNVRKMVRREIRIALAAEDLE